MTTHVIDRVLLDQLFVDGRADTHVLLAQSADMGVDVMRVL